MLQIGQATLALIADRDRQVKYGILKFVGSFRALTGDIDAYFLHGYNCVRINSCGLDAGAVSLVSDLRT